MNMDSLFAGDLNQGFLPVLSVFYSYLNKVISNRSCELDWPTFFRFWCFFYLSNAPYSAYTEVLIFSNTCVSSTGFEF